MEVGGDLTVVEPLDDEFVESLERRRRCYRIASLCLIAVGRRKSDVEVLASQEPAPALRAKKEALHCGSLALEVLDRSLLPPDLRCLNGFWHS
jgi:hypothetical protein